LSLTHIKQNRAFAAQLWKLFCCARVVLLVLSVFCNYMHVISICLCRK